MRSLTVAATQFACTWDTEANLCKAEELVRAAAAAGAQVILLQVHLAAAHPTNSSPPVFDTQELFETPYFCQDQLPEHFGLARPFDRNPVLQRFAALAAELAVVLPISYFERANNAHFNSIAVLDADGTCLGNYRKSHIPDGPGYQEKFYFSPGDTGFRVFDTKYCRLAPLICWDQWFSGAAACVALMGAELIVYPTAIGSEPQDPSLQSYPHWIRVQCGHAGANLVPVVTSNRIGTEAGKASEITFYGGSFVAGPTGEIVAQVGRHDDVAAGWPDPAPAKPEGFVTATFDLDQVATTRAAWGIYRDRRPDLYGALSTLDGVVRK